jgi:hypothetical protein
MGFTTIYRRYFQKSKLFLYPLLKIRQGSSIVPVETYMRWEDKYELGDNKLICVYHNRSDAEFKTFERDKLLANELFYDYFVLPEDMVAYVFDMTEHSRDYYKIANGRFSQLSNEYKFKIIRFFSGNPHHAKYMDSYLYPDQYFSEYAELLNCTVELLEEVGELCTPPDMDKETLLSRPIVLDITDNCLHLLKEN